MMRGYTTIEQSKKLTEILPIESADMCYRLVAYNPSNTYEYAPYCFRGTLSSDIPCWSASALLEIIRNNGRYELQMYEGGYYFEANGFITESYFNTVDACYEMIVKLHDLNIL